MDKLQWFKFSYADWRMGKIQKCSEVTQARFLNLCCLYWSKEANLSYQDAEIEIDKEHLDSLLSKKIIERDEEHIFIKFLDEQLEAITETSKGKSKAAKIRWDKYKKDKSSEVQMDADAMHVHTDAMQNDAEKRRGEKRREDNTKDDSKESLFDIFWTKYPKKVAKEKCRLKFNKLSTSDKDKILSTLDAYILYKPFKDYTHPNPETYLNQERWKDEIQTTSNKQQPATEDKFMQYVKMQQELYTPKN